MWWKLRFPETAPLIFIGPLRLEKRSIKKKTLRGRLPKGDRFESLRMLRSRSSEQDLSRLLRWNFLRFTGPLTYLCPSKCLLIKKRGNWLYNPCFFRLINSRQDKFCTLKIWQIAPKQIGGYQRQSQLSLASTSFRGASA